MLADSLVIDRSFSSKSANVRQEILTTSSSVSRPVKLLLRSFPDQLTPVRGSRKRVKTPSPIRFTVNDSVPAEEDCLPDMLVKCLLKDKIHFITRLRHNVIDPRVLFLHHVGCKGMHRDCDAFVDDDIWCADHLPHKILYSEPQELP